MTWSRTNKQSRSPAQYLTVMSQTRSARNANTKLLHSRLQSGALHPQPGRGAVWSGNGPVGLVERRQNLFAFGVVQYGAHIAGASVWGGRRDHIGCNRNRSRV